MNQKASIFTQIKRSVFISPVVKAISLVFNKLAPGWMFKKIENLLLTPNSKKINQAQIPHGIHPFKINTRDGIIQAYQLGHGPTVVLVHGWSGGAHQFFPLMRGLSQCGFKALTFDHYGHGHSEGKQSSLPLFVTAVNSVLSYVNGKNIDGMAAIVGHSMGCIAVVNARPKLIKEIPLFLISPIYNFKDYFSKQVNLLGLHPEITKKYLAGFNTTYLNNFDQMELDIKLQPYSEDTVIVHDNSDEESNFADSVKFTAVNPLTKLHVTRGLGHVRVINSESVWQQLKSHLNYEDITANPFKP